MCVYYMSIDIVYFKESILNSIDDYGDSLITTEHKMLHNSKTTVYEFLFKDEFSNCTVLQCNSYIF